MLLNLLLLANNEVSLFHKVKCRQKGEVMLSHRNREYIQIVHLCERYMYVYTSTHYTSVCNLKFWTTVRVRETIIKKK